MSRKTRGGLIGLLAAAVALVALGASAFGASSSKSVTNFASYIGSSKKGVAKGSVVKVGFLNQQGGQVVIGAKATIGAKAAVTYINKNGGIKGHPIKLDTCFIKSAEEEGSKCAQQFLKNKDVLVATGGVVTGIQSFYKTLNGKIPVITGVATTGIDGTQKNAVVLFGDSTHVLGPIGTYASKYLKAKTAALVYPNQAATKVGGLAIEAGLKAAGVKVTSATYDEGNANLTGVLQNAGADKADIVIPYSDAAGCANLAKALIAVGLKDPTKIVSAPLCLNGDVAQALGGNFANWTYSIASSNFGDTKDPAMVEYMKVYKSAGLKIGDAPDPWVIVDFGEMLTAAKILNQTGASAGESKIIKALKSFKGPQALGAPNLVCGKFSDAPSICNNQTQFFAYTGKSLKAPTWQHAKGSGWLKPPANLK